MHKCVLLLSKSSSKEEALEQVSEFMGNYQDKVFDWYSIGNRWNNILAPADLLEEFETWIKKEYAHVFSKSCYKIDDLENPKDRKIIQDKWKELGLKGQNPYYSAYGFKLDTTLDNYNCIPLKDCIDFVKSWCRDLTKEASEYWDKMMEAKAEETTINPKSTMSAYYAKRYAEAIYDDFCFESNVFNITENIGETIPDDIENYYVTVIDMHD